MTKKQRNLKAKKIINKRKKLEQLTSCCLKFLEDGFTQDDVERICNVYLKHHLIKMGIQSGPNTMDHGLTTFFYRHSELIWW
jgi:hypothetical protein